MAAPIKADIIYYRSDSDFELEFNLCGCCNMRLLSDKPKSSSAFVHSLDRAVSRSQIIFAIGKTDGEGALLPVLCAAIDYELAPRDLAAFGLNQEVLLPRSSIPLISSDGQFGGCVIECGPQSIIVLTDDRELRRTICKELVHDYVRDTAHNINKAAEPDTPKKKETPEPAPVFDENYVINEDDNKPDFSSLEQEFENLKERKPRKALRRLLTLFFILLFLAIGALAYMFFAEPLVIKKLYTGYSEMYGSTHKTDDGILDSMGDLHKFNADTVGFLRIDGTDITYPIVTEINKGEGYYKNHLYNDWYSYLYGTPYIKGDITAQTYYRNIVVYGKDAHGDVMFAELKDIASVEGYRTAPTIKFDTLYSSDTYKIFAAFTCDGTADDNLLKTSFFDDKEFSEHLENLLELSQIKTAVDVKASDEIITLISYGENDTVVVARRLRAGESPLVDTQSATKNDGDMQVNEDASNSNTALLQNMQPMGNIKYSEFSPIYEQGAPLSPEQAEEYSAEYNKEESSSESEDASDSSSNTSSQTGDTSNISSQTPEDTAMNTYGNRIIAVIDSATGERVSGTTYNILCRMVEAEMGGSYSAEALKAQAVASYGWLITNGVESKETPIVRLKTASNAVCAAVKSVIGLKPYIGGKVAQTMYFPCSAGYTADCSTFYSHKIPYLTATDSSVDRNCISFTTHRTYSAKNVQKWVLEETGIDLSSVADKSRWFNISYDRYGAYAECVIFGNTNSIYSGRYLRECVFTIERVGAENTLNSTAYKITYQSDSDTFLFETKGQGHGIGMSQYGAERLAKTGLTYLEILKHYYGDMTVDY